MNPILIEQLSQITEEEQRLLDGASSIDPTIYSDSPAFVIDSHKMLQHGKLIQVRPHTRFIHFPKHTHNYVEMIYMCSGQTTHIIDNSRIVLNTGELLLLNQHATQEILPAGFDDIAVNFIVLPEFFDQTLSMLGSEHNMLRDFIVGCLQSSDSPVSYLHFKVSQVLPVQNLIENLVWTIAHDIQNKRLMNQITMGLLFLQLLNHTDKIETGTNSYEQEILMHVFQYIEEHYRDGELTSLANHLGCEFTWLSKTIKRLTGHTYTDLVQKKRLNQACFLLRSTTLSVTDISLAVGYDNFSYFHRIFRKDVGMSPRSYRVSAGADAAGGIG
ncbi:MAG: AraC family transcriptional regulator [Eubacteriales bacterium]|nr:AraC family transcriptional regulator [Eubacteriales bacterium]